MLTRSVSSLKATVCICAFFAASFVSGTFQTITFYANSHCIWNNETINGTETDLRSSWVTNATSVHVVGVWLLYFENRSNDLERYSISVSDTLPPLGKCANVYGLLDTVGVGSRWDNFRIYAAKRIGPQDISTSQLVLYTGLNFTGLEYSIDKDNVIALEPDPVRIQSYAHFSNDTWTLFSKVGYNGTTEYLFPYNQNDEDPRDDFAFRRDANLYIGSIKKGLHEGNDGKGREGKCTENYSYSPHSNIYFSFNLYIV